MPDPAPAPRIAAIDAVRGVAVMGILFLNIVSFGMPDAAYLSPRAYGWAGPADRFAYYLSFVLFDGKMRGLFSFLFGASLLLIVDRAEAAGANPAAIHYRRMAWLALFGLAHAVLLWLGDILLHYAIIGSLAYGFRHFPVRKLMLFGLTFALVELLLMGTIPLSWLAMQAEGGARAAAKLHAFEEAFGIPDPATIARQLALFRGGYGGIVAFHLREMPDVLSDTFVVGFETLAYMLFGMAALRSGLLTGAWPRARYRRWAIVGLGVGGGGYALLAAWMAARGLDSLAVASGPLVLGGPLRIAMIPGWAALIVLATRGGGTAGRRLAAVGRMALSNYLATSIAMCALFYGWGFGLYGHLSRAQLYLPVAGMCIGMLWWSPLWLARFRYGPFEWAWRSLARWQWQPLRVEARGTARQAVATDTQ
ncbi:DUF418 domain-containing protein [Sphingomonas sp. VNH70]|uniref:DUF418 domain-containing protein n=1 Tax=Sphingomonas silueang TaxID=3156617 RepID=UPI0032B4EE59